jgi:hypothetical protein
VSRPSQLTLGDELGRDDHVDVIVCDRWGRLVGVIPAFLGDRGDELHRQGWSLHAATVWAYLAVQRAEQLPPTWARLPCHDDASPSCVAT